MEPVFSFIFSPERAPTPSCHASTVLKTPHGVAAAWFGGLREGADDVRIYVSFLRNGVWSEPFSPTPEPGAHWNPVLFSPDGEKISLYYKTGVSPSAWKTFVTETADGSRWTEPRELVPGDESDGRGPVKNKCLCLSSGRILAPGSTEAGLWRARIDRSDDGGQTWIVSDIPMADGLPEKAGVIQPTLWEDGGIIHALLRSNTGRLFSSRSDDGGVSWSPASPTAFPNNNSGLDAVRVPDGRVFLVCNPVEGNWGKRSPLSVFVSPDNGAHFEKCADLETGDGEFSYPAVIADGSNLLITYTWNRERIRFCTFPIPERSFSRQSRKIQEEEK